MALFPQGLQAADEISAGEVLTLERCIDIAKKNYPGLLSAAGSVEASRSRVQQAEAGYYPQVNLSSGYSRIGPADSNKTTSSNTSPYDEYQSSVNLSQTIYDFGRTPGNVEVSSLSAEASQADMDSETINVVFAVKQAFFGLLQARQDRDALLESVAQYELHLRQAKGFYETGIKPKIDVTKAEVDLSQAKLALLKAQNAVRIARITLNNAMGIPDAPEYGIQDTPGLQDYATGLDEALKRGYDSRPDLRAARARREAAQRSVDLAEKGYYPVLSGNAGYGWTGEEFPLDRQWSVGATVDVPLFSGFSTRSQISEARGNLAVTMGNEELVRQSVRYDIEQAFSNLTEVSERIALAELSVRQARENRDLAQGRYAAGIGNPIEVTDALVSETVAKIAYSNALYDYRIAVASLEKAMGVTP
ncbi:MAG TPA: TolC family protein [Deltaproteobacteria bacterium]|nr:TolC family protein [Deltaproteobacteria bacterium]HPR55824.1 TolC family protein [Deltaproteobacteria bacterium]HXK47707.1 TolC family protein [Deltaproteobacteria bacterium]